MSTGNVAFYGKMTKIIFKSSSNVHLNLSSDTMFNIDEESDSDQDEQEPEEREETEKKSSVS